MADSIYTDVTNVIAAGGYDLADLLHRIDVLYAGGRLTDAEREDLYGLARAGADPDASKGTESDRISRLEAQILDLSDRVTALENDGTVPEPTIEEYDKKRWYRRGEKCIWKGKVYAWDVDGSQNGVLGVWSPEEYPAGWTLIGDAPQGQ